MRLTTTFLICLVVAPPLLAAPIDEFRLTDIEQNIRTLEATVREQARQIAELQRQPNNSPIHTTTNYANGNDPRWLSHASWTLITPGMNELQVIELLGPPTQQRLADDSTTRALLYALEIGRSGFLTGRVTLSNGKVTAVEIPSLK
ncbi:MAG: hypothetical protein AB7F79_02335 [Steroidobacteraceae bacterium]